MPFPLDGGTNLDHLRIYEIEPNRCKDGASGESVSTSSESERGEGVELNIR